jgi:peptidoglycan/LPS O-acetylase OafA/YrhL
MEAMIFGFSLVQNIALAAGLVVIFIYLQVFEVKSLPEISSVSQVSLIRFCGRYSLEIYVIHLLLLKLVWMVKNLVAHLIG